MVNGEAILLVMLCRFMIYDLCMRGERGEGRQERETEKEEESERGTEGPKKPKKPESWKYRDVIRGGTGEVSHLHT